MSPDDKRAALTEAAQLGAAYFTALIEERLARADAMDMANNFALMFLVTKGVITAKPPTVEGDEWKGG